ncbi:HAMP domain-containing protein [Paenibacillus sp. LMG 31456]|uniref:histidine kinase n=1 Tax=Paenibacillus foliorum TaxID=2654974 RepID=A0A972GN09_9BACL|nr:HAMP domain-containing sensor histidine kinase [Paenibacillus foliorum]NOU93020.1 HAMP domain-containing protein [Paenibacillus foliorum]
MGLRNKLFLQHTVTIIMLLTAMYFIVNYTLSKSMIERDTQTLSQYFALHRIEALKIVNDKKINIEQLFSGAYAPLIASHLAANSNFQVQLFALDGTIVGNSGDKENLLKRSDIETVLTGQTATVITEAADTQYLIYSAPFWYEGKIVGGFRYLLDLNQHVQTQTQMRYWFIGVALVCLLISLLASYSFFSILMKPLQDLQQALRLVSIGNFSKKIVVNSHDEVRELAADFNHMSDALQQHIELLHYEQGKQKTFYDNMTHELKTPLTSIIGFSDLIAKMDQLDDIRTCNIYIRKESDRLLNMVEDLLQTSLKGNEAWRVKLEQVDLASILTDSLRILEPTIQKSSIITTLQAEPCEVYLDPKLTQQVLFNVIDNAIRHGECTHLHISLESYEGQGQVRIVDNGKGIAEQARQTLFLPSEYKQDRIISAQSHGLGLPLCKQFMELQGGSILIISQEGKGTEVQLRFNTSPSL